MRCNLDHRRRDEGSCGMRRLAAYAVAVLVGLAVLTLARPAPSRAAAGGCSISSAPKIASGQTQRSDPNACPDNRQYWAMNLKIGASLDVDVTPRSSGGLVQYHFFIYGPNAGSIGSALCGNNYSSPTTISCLIPASGRYVLVAGDPGSFTPMVKSVPPQAGRVAGSCDPANAPVAAPGVTQYANAQLCGSSTKSEAWSVVLHRGDSLVVNITPIGAYSSFATWVQVYGPAPTSAGTKLCGDGYYDPTTLRCPITRGGRYLIEASQAPGAISPLPIHPTRTAVTAPAFVKGGGAIPIRIAISSNTADPLGTCVVQEQVGARWKAVASARSTTGVCSARVPAPARGTVHLRVHFAGKKGWASSTSKIVSVVVR